MEAHHADYVMRRLEMDVFPVLGHKPVGEVTAPQLLAMAKRIESRGDLDIAKRALQTCGQVLRFAVAHGLAERNPAVDVKPSDALKARKKTNYARLDAQGVPTLLRRVDAYPGTGTPYDTAGDDADGADVCAHRRTHCGPLGGIRACARRVAHP